MTWRGVVLVEEESARVAVEEFARRLGIGASIKVLPHEGKADLEGSMQRKIRGWRSPFDPRFLIARDGPADARDALKERLQSLVPEGARPRTRIRIVVHELETWFLGDPDALAASGILHGASAERRARKLAGRDLCVLSNPSEELARLVRISGKIACARSIAPHMSLKDNRARSFLPFIEALEWAAQ